MAVRDTERLRQMVTDYYHGLLTEDSYREQRAGLLDNLGVDVPDREDSITRAQAPVAEKAPSPPPREEKPASDADTSSGSKKRALGGVAIAAIVGVAIAAYVMLIPGTDSGMEREQQLAESGSDIDSELEGGEALIQDFLDRNDWTSDSLSNFLLTWSLLNDDQRDKAVSDRRYRRLTTRLHQRIREEAALSNVANSPRMEALTGFAATIGAPYRESPASDPIPEPDVVVDVGTEFELDDAESEPQVAVAASADTVIVPEANTQDESVEPKVTAATLETETDMPPEKPVAESEPEPEPEPIVSTVAAVVTDDPCPAGIASTRQPYCRDKLAAGDDGPPLVVLRTGTYEMGSSADESESPAHQVDIGYQIAISRFEITADEYEQFCVATSLLCEEKPWDADYPVVSVSWDDAILYTQWLSEATGFTYRLPSEAEWEFAARAGTQSPYFFGDEITPTAAHSSVNGPTDSPVPTSNRKINRNPFRLYHISGNVREWTQDAWYPNYDNAPANGSTRTLESEDRRVVRGGSYSDADSKLRSAAREPLGRSHRDAMTGFRIVREVLPQATDK